MKNYNLIISKYFLFLCMATGCSESSSQPIRPIYNFECLRKTVPYRRQITRLVLEIPPLLDMIKPKIEKLVKLKSNQICLQNSISNLENFSKQILTKIDDWIIHNLSTMPIAIPEETEEFIRYFDQPKPGYHTDLEYIRVLLYDQDGSIRKLSYQIALIAHQKAMIKKLIRDS